MSEITIRPAEAGDRERWAELFKAYGGFYQISVAPDVMDRVWSWIFDPAVEFWCDVAVNPADEVVGFTQYQSMLRSLSGGKVFYLSDIFVHPDARGEGTGRALIDRVLAVAAEQGAPSVRWLTQEHNHTARRLYESYAPRTEFILYAVPVAD